MDMYNSEILSYSLSTQPNGKTVMEGLKEAISQTNDCPYRRTFHSDQGWAYQMNVYIQTLRTTISFKVCLEKEPV